MSNVVSTSKFLSLVLRHQPEVIGLSLDDSRLGRHRHADPPLAGAQAADPRADRTGRRREQQAALRDQRGRSTHPRQSRTFDRRRSRLRAGRPHRRCCITAPRRASSKRSAAKAWSNAAASMCICPPMRRPRRPSGTPRKTGRADHRARRDGHSGARILPFRKRRVAHRCGAGGVHRFRRRVIRNRISVVALPTGERQRQDFRRPLRETRYCFANSIRRFWARPSGVALSVIGWSEP
jgi:hypothetical protein